MPFIAENATISNLFYACKATFRICSYVSYSKYLNRKCDHKKLKTVLAYHAFVMEHTYAADSITALFLSNGKMVIIYFDKHFFVMRWNDLLMCISLCSYFRQTVAINFHDTDNIPFVCHVWVFVQLPVRGDKKKTVRANAHTNTHMH